MPSRASEPVSAPDGWDPERYRRHAAFVPALAGPILDWLDWQPGERILDLGCGDGVLGAHLAGQKVEIYGCDRSPRQAGAARANGLLRTVVADGAALPFGPVFDAVFSNAALHWMRPPDAVAASIANALRPGGRMVAEMGGAGNVAVVRAALHESLRGEGIDPAGVDPWYFPDPPAYRAVLAGAGLTVERIELVERPTAIPGALADWVETLASPFCAAVAPDRCRAFLAAVTEQAAPALKSADGGWTLDYVRLRVRAVKGSR
jgi:SAM-dependent methyltransferase